MRIPLPRYRQSYTGAAVAVMMIVFVLIALIAHQLFSFVRPAWIQVGFGVFFAASFLILDPLRSLLYRIVERAAHPKPIMHGVMREELTTVFIEQADLYDTCRRVSGILEAGYHINDVVVHLRHQDRYYRIGDETETRIENDALLDYLESTAGDIGELYHQVGEVRGGEVPAAVVDYLSKYHIVYVLPLVLEKGLFGYITMHQFDERYRLLEQDRFFLKSIQGLISVALRRLRIDRNLQQRIEELQAVNRISHTMNSSLNVKETLESVMDVITEMTNCDRALMYLRDEDGDYFIPTMARGLSDDIDLDFAVRTKDSIFRHVVETREPMVVDDVDNDERVNKEYASRVQTKSFVVVPMVSKEEVIGIVGVDNLSTGREIAQIQVDLLVTLANHAAIALENSRLYERTERFNEELQERIHEATADLEQIVDMKSHFLTVASHQLRTPSTVVRGLLSMLKEDPGMPQEERDRYVSQAFSSMSRLERIVSDLLSATEFEGKRLRPLIEECFPAEVAEMVVNEFGLLATEKGVSLVLDLQVGKDLVMTSDQHRLREALSNLVDNAILYSPEGAVTVRVSADKDAIAFSVIDNGVGLSVEDEKIIFEKFQRGRTVRTIAPNGSGLGLYIVNRIAEALGGSVVVRSDGPGTGSEFILRVPQVNTSVSE